MAKPQIARFRIKAASISNWHGVCSAVLGNLTNNNVILGANGACKTSILEAIHFALGTTNQKQGDLSDALRSHQRFQNGEAQFPVEVALVLERTWPTPWKFSPRLDDALGALDPEVRNRLLQLWGIATLRILWTDSDSPPVRTLQYSTIPGWFTPEAGLVLDLDALRRLHDKTMSSNPLLRESYRGGEALWQIGFVEQCCLIPAFRDRLLIYPRPHTASGDDTPERKIYRITETAQSAWVHNVFQKRVQGLAPRIPKLTLRSNSNVFTLEEFTDSTFEIPEEREARGHRDVFRLFATIDDPCPEHVPSVVLIDEPELSKNEAIQRTFHDALLRYFPETQFFFTTHSSVFAEDRASSSLHFLRQSSGGATSIFLTKDDRAALKELRDSLGISNSQFFALKLVVFVEGEMEEACVSRVLDALGHPPGLSTGIKIANARGVGKLKAEWIKPQLAILRDTWTRAAIWADDEGDLRKERSAILAVAENVLSDQDLVLWSDFDQKWTRFIDTFSHSLLLDVLNRFLSSEGFTKSPDEISKTLDLGSKPIEPTISRYWYEVTKTTFPKAAFGRRLGESLADNIRSGGGRSEVIVSLCEKAIARANAK